MWCVKWCLCLVLVQCVFALKDECAVKITCRECIGTPNCHWCSEPVEGEIDIHCVEKSKTFDGWCRNGSKTEYKTSYQPSPEETGSHQIHPQKARLKLRLGEEKKIYINFTKAKDYPVDLYYLMDLSKSMEDDKKKISLLGESLTRAMKRLTENFRLGFGSFVDKTTLPFVSTVPQKLKHPCAGCAPPYSFKNHMPLNTNTKLFATEVMKAPVSGNLDYPEGGFDALMQAMVCTDQIKWRSDARRLLVFSTDATFHVAGDGKLAGIVEPNDGLCHMENDEYTGGLLYDYPSIAQLDNKAVENNINIIFAVEEHQQNIYKKLTKHITGSAFGKLTESSENVVDLVYAQSEKLTQSVTMTARASNEVDVRFYSSCLNPDGELKETDKCDGVKQEDTITFEARIKMLDCPSENVLWKEKIAFRPVGINETLEVELEVYCGCECEKDVELNSMKCSNNGNLSCGICECNKGWTGNLCECDMRGLSKDKDDSHCRKDNSSEVCSGRGNCRCGVCNCYKRNDKDQIYSGKYCECDNFSCNRHEGKLCSGLSNGRCKCGKCQCQPGWEGDACQILINPKECIDPDTGLVCSDHGECINGKCICDQQKYAGKYCQECVFCPGGRCKELRDCVECLAYNTGIYANDCKQRCNLTITIVDKLTEDDAGPGENFCQQPDDSSCTIVFLYQEINGEVNVTAQREKDCRGAENVFAVVFGVVGATILIGLLFILIWKLLTSIHDRREYAKFEKERALSRFDRGENPLYRGAVTKFDNPTFSGN